MMLCRGLRDVGVGPGALAWFMLVAAASGQEITPGPIHGSAQSGPCPLTARQLVRMSQQELDQLYLQATAGPIPEGKVRGTTIFSPGSALAPTMSKGARVLWQGKVFHGADSTAINKFFGVKVIKADVAYGPSWMDGRPSIILDYSETSHVYARYRDEIRQVAPGLLLGIMYARTCPQPTLKMYFVLETCP
jgi:hypothetical protein